MIKMLDATCTATVVEVEGVPVPEAVIFSEGVGASEGKAFIQGDEVAYITSNAADIKTLLTKLGTILTDLITALTVIDVKPVGGAGSAPAPGAAANIASITSVASELAVLKETLK